MPYKDVTPPAGEKISRQTENLIVPDHPVIPFIRGDGTGPDIWAASVRVFDAAVEKAYGGKKKIAWFEVFAGQAAKDKFDNWLPDDTVEAFREYLVGIKGPLTTPVGGGIRSLNVALRQMLDLFVCLRPVQYFKGVPSPVKHPEKVDMVIFRENTEDIYAGIEWAAGTPEAQKVLDFLEKEFPKDVRENPLRHEGEGGGILESSRRARELPSDVMVGVGIKPVSRSGSVRLIHSAISYAIQNKRKSVTLVHKGNIMKFTEGAFRDWGYEIAKNYFGAEEIDGGPWCKIPEGKPGAGIVIKDAIADITLAAGADAAGRFRCHRDAESEWRLPERRARGASRRHRHRARRQHQLHHRPRRFRSDSRHRAEVCEPGQGESGLGDFVRRNDVPLHGLDRSGRSDPERIERRDREQERDLRFRAADGWRDRDQVLRVRR